MNIGRHICVFMSHKNGFLFKEKENDFIAGIEFAKVLDEEQFSKLG